MKIDRPGAAIVGAVLMVAFRIVGPQEALQSIDFATIVLLFSMMLGPARLLRRPVHHRRGGRSCRPHCRSAATGRTMGSASRRHLRPPYHRPLQFREQRAGGDGPADRRRQFSGIRMTAD
jgi:hypothetical protein